MATLLNPNQNRIEVIDAFRGFALAGIVIVHMVEQYLASLAPEGKMLGLEQGLTDTIINAFIFIFLRGKFFAIFSILFGLSFFIQTESAHKKGNKFTRIFLWKLAILFLIGYVHHLFYRGDILTIYAVTGLCLIPFFKLSEKYVLLASGILFLGIGRYIIFILFGDQPILLAASLSPTSPSVLNYFEILKQGTLRDVLQLNSIEGMIEKIEFQIGIFSRAYLTVAFFLVGLFLGRIKFFQNIEKKSKQIKKALLISLVVLVVAVIVMAGLFALASSSGEMNMNSWTAMFAFTFFDIANLAMTILILTGFSLLYYHKKWHSFLNKFTAYGRTALTNYVTQTFLGTFIFYGWGLGYLGDMRNSISFLIAIGIITAQIIVSTLWMKHFKYGPLEWLWRSVTYFKFQPFKKKQELVAH